MARYQVILTYDGTAFSGMQRQANARTVQGEIENALKEIGWKGQSIIVAGRTDTGVHAAGQVIAFDLEWAHSIDDLKNALNANFPQDVATSQVNLAREDFHPRYDALSRTYRYQIFCQSTRDPIRERFAWRIWPEIDLNRMEICAIELVGKHDFAAFGTPPKEGGATVRQIHRATWRQDEDRYVFEVEGNAFLYHMVRRMVNIQVEVGQGKLEPEIITRYLAGEMKGMIQGLAPPHGLYLTEVSYPDEVIIQETEQ
jgi:tRNA pseudouridine38-40 synthase